MMLPTDAAMTTRRSSLGGTLAGISLPYWLNAFPTRRLRFRPKNSAESSSPHPSATSSSGTTSTSSAAWPRSSRSSFSRRPPGGGLPQHRGDLLGRLPDTPAGGVPLRLARRQGGPEVHLHRHADRYGRGDGPHRLCSKLRLDRPRRGVHPLRAPPDPGPLPRRGIRRGLHPPPRVHLRGGTRVPHPAGPTASAARPPRVAPDPHTGPRPSWGPGL